MRQRKPKKLLERDIKRLIVEFLEAKRIVYFRAQPVRIAKDGTFVYVLPSQLGAPDLFIFPHYSVYEPRFIGAEIKAPGGKLSEQQIKWREKLELVGAAYVVIDSLEAADAFMRSLA